MRTKAKAEKQMTIEERDQLAEHCAYGFEVDAVDASKATKEAPLNSVASDGKIGDAVVAILTKAAGASDVASGSDGQEGASPAGKSDNASGQPGGAPAKKRRIDITLWRSRSCTTLGQSVQAEMKIFWAVIDGASESLKSASTIPTILAGDAYKLAEQRRTLALLFFGREPDGHAEAASALRDRRGH